MEHPSLPDQSKHGGKHWRKWSYYLSNFSAELSELKADNIKLTLSGSANTLTITLENIDFHVSCNARFKTKIAKASGSAKVSAHFSKITAVLTPSAY